MKSLVKRKLKKSGIAAVVVVSLFVIWTIYSGRVQTKVDARIVEDIHELIEQRLAALPNDDPIIRRYGAFKWWERGDWSRPHYLGMLVSRLDTRGIAHFEKVDQEVHVFITSGPKVVDFQMYPTDEWLEEMPDKRRLDVSGRGLFTEIQGGGRGQAGINAQAQHPEFVAK